jgi:hypothetical protein
MPRSLWHFQGRILQFMQVRTLTVVTVLVDLKNAFLTLLDKKHKNPALLMMYAFIDICAALVNDGKTGNREIFEACLQDHVMMSVKPFTTYDLWAARSSLLHAFSPPFGYHTEKVGGARPIFYWAWPESPEDVRAALKSKGYTDFILLDVEDVKYLALDVINSILMRLDKDPAFEDRFLANSQHFLFDLQTFRLEAEWSVLGELAKKRTAGC